MDFPKLKFPLFPLPSNNWSWQDRVLFLNGLVVDERNMPGKTLGVRRIQCRRADLLPLKKPIFTVPQLMHHTSKFFIDMYGTPIIYNKTKSSKLSCYKIRSIERRETASLLWLHEVNFPITIPRPPMNKPQWARMLHLNGIPWMLYDYVSQPTKDTYRRV